MDVAVFAARNAAGCASYFAGCNLEDALMRISHCFSVALLVVFLSSGCTFDTEPEGAPTADTITSAAATAPVTADTAASVTITFAAEGTDRAVSTALIQRFEQDNPAIHVQFVALDSLLTPEIAANGSKQLNLFLTLRDVMH